jgi:hypothetical protein
MTTTSAQVAPPHGERAAPDAADPLPAAPDAAVPFRVMAASAPPQIPPQIPPQQLPPKSPAARPAIPAAGPTGPPHSEHRSPWPGLVSVAMLLAGGITVLLGIILPAISADKAKAGTITFQIAVYAVSWALLAGAPGEATRGRRIMLAILGASALLVVAWLVLDLPLYLQYWKIPETPLYLFWLFAGVLEIGAALLGGSRPTRRLELISGGLTGVFGLLILYFVAQQWDLALVRGFSLYFIALGVTWVLIGLSRRRATRVG